MLNTERVSVIDPPVHDDESNWRDGEDVLQPLTYETVCKQPSVTLASPGQDRKECLSQTPLCDPILISDGSVSSPKLTDRPKMIVLERSVDGRLAGRCDDGSREST